MKKMLILAPKDLKDLYKDFDPSRRFDSVDKILNSKPLKDAEIILVQTEHNDDYFFILKDHSFKIGGYIHKVDVADFCLGKDVRLYNRQETFRNDHHELDGSMKKLDGHINALHRMELED
jgi:hypothetical protein